jgi:hypothetical protein
MALPEKCRNPALLLERRRYSEKRRISGSTLGMDDDQRSSVSQGITFAT